jgi:hypothetical protein
MRIKKLFISFYFLIPVLLIASLNESLPSWHWSYHFIDDLRLRGAFQDLYSLNKPFTRGEVAESLVKLRKIIMTGEISLSSSHINHFYKLVEEFAPEIQEIQKKEFKSENIELGIRIQGDLDKEYKNDLQYRGVYRTKISVPIGKYLTIYNGVNFDQYLVRDPSYIGKKWRGVVGYTEQAYASIGFGNFRFKFGRDFLRWGAGENRTLLFSDLCRPLDHFLSSIRMGPFKYSFMTSVLDDMELSPELVDSLGGSSTNRYLSSHRLDVSFFNGRLQCAITETILYGGVNRKIDWVYINPFIFYHGAQLNKSGSANTFGSIDLILFPLKRWELYTSFLIDDIQIEKTGAGDLEPDEIGWLIGSRWGEAFDIPGFTLATEYVQVTNRTYKTPNVWEVFAHRNIAMGHPLGNDFTHWQIDASQWIGTNMWIKLGYGITRKGEGSLFTSWDEPWMDFSVEEGYSEPFPTGIVEKRKSFNLQIHLYPSINWGIQAEFNWLARENAEHIKDLGKDENSWRIGLWFYRDVGVKIK